MRRPAHSLRNRHTHTHTSRRDESKSRMSNGGGLSLDMSISCDNDVLGATFRTGGMSIGSDHMRLFGEDVPLEVSITDLIFGNKIGQGACSTVNIATHRVTGEKFAVKMFNVYDSKQAAQLYNEIMLLTSFQCDALISLKGAFHDEGSIGVILEYMDRGSLEFLCVEDVCVNEEVVAAIAFQMIWGLGFLHYERQIHRDIKPGNALMNSQGQVKLSDFGISKELESTAGFSSTSIGSFRYMSPERLLAERYDASSDIWSVGMTLLELWNKSYPFRVRSPIELSTELHNFDVRRHLRGPSASKTFVRFLDDMLQSDPNQRLSCIELTRHAWFEEMRISTLDEACGILRDWLGDLDRRRARVARDEFSKPCIAFSERTARPSAQLPVYGGVAQRPPRTLSAAVIKEAIGEMSMSMSVTHEEMMQLRANNPFIASGSLSTSSNSNLPTFVPGTKSFVANHGNRGMQHKGIEEDEEYEYDDDFEVEPYDVKSDDFSSKKSRSQFSRSSQSSANTSPSPYGPGSSNSVGSRQFNHK